MSAVEVRFQNLSVEADVHVGGRALPTVLNSVLNFVEVSFIGVITGQIELSSLCRLCWRISALTFLEQQDIRHALV